MTLFKNISLQEWRQFKKIDIDLSSQITILTGPNGCGKTTILNVLGRHFGWNINFTSSPRLGSKKVWSDIWGSRDKDLTITQESVEIGQITYSDDSACSLHVTPSESPQYHPQYLNQQIVIGLHIPSHRPIISYVPIEDIPTNPKTNQQHFQDFQHLLLQTYGSLKSQNPGMALKKSLIAIALLGPGNEYVQPNNEYRDLFEQFQEILRKVLPKSLGFKKIEIRMPSVVFVTDSGDFLLDSMSGGVNALVGMAWQIHVYGADKENCTVIIDEPENHLHPSIQREIIPNFREAFPNYQFIISTHSPFILSSDPNSTVYGLMYNENRKIISEEISEANLSGSANQISREILCVPTTIPIWVEKKIKTTIEKYANEENRVELIFDELKSLGLNDAITNYFKKTEL